MRGNLTQLIVCRWSSSERDTLVWFSPHPVMFIAFPCFVLAVYTGGQLRVTYVAGCSFSFLASCSSYLGKVTRDKGERLMK